MEVYEYRLKIYNDDGTFRFEPFMCVKDSLGYVFLKALVIVAQGHTCDIYYNDRKIATFYKNNGIIDD